MKNLDMPDFFNVLEMMYCESGVNNDSDPIVVYIRNKLITILCIVDF